ncbi:MBL fold metallo-hydrolase [Flagellimonas flava]|uniref:Metallo-beta-lactamase superfamily protein n=1 Tax=Flagellimonas flava TaxID=570519 RepID=A0A1M5MK96_9FLAO|nr:MBL fold metallo-hydrolase [Allomuricauda flava]SHG77607.1 Metallo-beta-lactamase superfamily protein [Allomuricauda flava]
MGKKCIIGTLLILLAGCKYQPNGKEILAKIKSHYDQKPTAGLHVSYQQVGFNPYQSYDYEHPDSLRSMHMVNLDGQRFFAERRAWFPGGFEFGLKEFQQDSVGYQYDLKGIVLGKRVIKQPKERIEEVREELTELVDFRFSQKFLSQEDRVSVDTLDFRKNLTTLIQITDEQDTLKVTYQIEPVALQSISFNGSEEEWLFNNINGGSYMDGIQHFKNGSLKGLYTLEQVKQINSIAQEHFYIPEEYSMYQPEKKQPSVEKIGPDLYLVKSLPADRNVLFTTDPNGITVFGAPISDRLSQLVIDLITTRFPEEQIHAVYVTHAHSDHIGGLPAYAKLGATILADAYSILAIKAYPKFGDTIDSFVFKEVVNESVIGDAQFFVVDNSHSKGQSFVYFRANEVMYQGDFFEIPADNTFPHYVPNATREFMEFIATRNLSVKRIVAHHRNDFITMDLLQMYYDSKK